jgi:hypothetical protein
MNQEAKICKEEQKWKVRMRQRVWALASLLT